MKDDWGSVSTNIPCHDWQFCWGIARLIHLDLRSGRPLRPGHSPPRCPVLCMPRLKDWRIEGCIACYMMYHGSDPRTSRALSRYFQVNMIEASERDSHQFAIGVPELHAGCHSMSFHFPYEHTFCGHNASIHFYSNHIFAVPWITMNNLHHSL